MKRFKIQGHASLREEMKAVARSDVARSEKPTPKDAGGTTLDSIEVLVHPATRRETPTGQTTPEMRSVVFE